MDKKIKAIIAFEIQFVTHKSDEPNSISGLIEQIKNTNAIFGRPINAKYAEGFNITSYLGVADFYCII